MEEEGRGKRHGFWGFIPFLGGEQWAMAASSAEPKWGESERRLYEGEGKGKKKSIVKLKKMK